MRDFDPRETFAGKTVPVAFLSTLTLESSPGGSERAQMISLTTLMQPPNHVVTSTLRIEVLLVAPDPADVRALTRIFLHSNWRLLTCGSEAEVTAMILSHPIGVAICNENVWKNLLHAMNSHLNHPKLFVASSDASASLWTEALNMGADYVLQKPFDPKDVLRSVSDAWQRWQFTLMEEKKFDSAARLDRKPMAFQAASRKIG